MSLKTDYKDEILRDGEDRRYNLVDENGRVVYSNIKLDKAYTPQQEGDEFNAKDVNEIHGRLNGLAPMNLLINGDFQCNQRGQSSYENSSGNIVYTLDMWYALWCTVTKLDKGIKITPIDNGFIQQYVDDDLTDKRVTLVLKELNGQTYELSGVVNKTTSLVYEGTKLNLVVQYVSTNNKYKVNIVAKSEISIEYIDLFEGSIAYPHVKEDHAIALMRCQRYLYRLKFQVGNGNIYRNAVYIFIPVPVSMISTTPTITVSNYKALLDGMCEYDISYVDFCNGNDNGISVRFILTSSFSESFDGRSARVIPKNDSGYIDISCEPL
jgi:hypothetical protein|nr:MAG TPA: hypothetical protein [Caudoviricetes sp.]